MLSQRDGVRKKKKVVKISGHDGGRGTKYMQNIYFLFQGRVQKVQGQQFSRKITKREAGEGKIKAKTKCNRSISSKRNREINIIIIQPIRMNKLGKNIHPLPNELSFYKWKENQMKC